MPNDEDYHKPIITNSGFNSNYVLYESMGGEGKYKMLTVNEYLDIIRPYLRDIVDNYKTQGEWRIHSHKTTTKHKTQSEWKIQLKMENHFISSKPDSDETRTMRTKNDNIEIMMGSETDEVIEELFKFLSRRYKKNLQESIKGSEFIFDGADALYYDLNKIRLSRGGSYIDSPEWLKNKKATLNPNDNDDKCFEYALNVALNYQNIKNNPERISKIKPFTNQNNFKEIYFPSHRKDWKKFELNNKSIALNILYVPYNTKKIRHAYKSKYNVKRKFK